MTSPTSYTLLVEAIQDMAEDDSTEFNDFIPKAVNMAEDRLFRELNINYSTDGTVSTVIGSPSITKPTDLRETEGMFIVVSGNKTPLIKRSSEFLMDYWPSDSVRDTPKYYSDNDLTTWRIAPTPDAAYSITVNYTAKPAYLSSSNTTNVYTDKYPDMLFYASMVNMCEFMKDTERKQEWTARLQESTSTVNFEGTKNRKEDTPAKLGK